MGRRAKRRRGLAETPQRARAGGALAGGAGGRAAGGAELGRRGEAGSENEKAIVWRDVELTKGRE